MLKVDSKDTRAKRIDVAAVSFGVIRLQKFLQRYRKLNSNEV